MAIQDILVYTKSALVGKFIVEGGNIWSSCQDLHLDRALI